MSYVTDVGWKTVRDYKREMFARGSNCQADCRRVSVGDIGDLVNKHDIVVADREFTFEKGEEKSWEERFQPILEFIAKQAKGEMLSISSFGDFLESGEAYKDFLPANKLVTFKGYAGMYLLRYTVGGLNILSYDPTKPVLERFEDETNRFLDGCIPPESLGAFIDEQYEKPDPRVLKAVIDHAVDTGKAPEHPKVLMVGDMYAADVILANLYKQQFGDEADVHSCLVKSYGLLHEKRPTILITRIIDRSLGNLFSFCTDTKKHIRSWDRELMGMP